MNGVCDPACCFNDDNKLKIPKNMIYDGGSI